MFATLCPHCRSNLTAVDNLVGHTMLCPLCHRPFVATPTPTAVQAAAPTEEMPVTARARRKQMSPAQIILTIFFSLLAVAAVVVLLICMGFNHQVQRVQNERLRKTEDLRKAARMAFVDQGYNSVQLLEDPTTHELGYSARAVGTDKWAQKQRLTMVFRYDGALIEVLMLTEGDKYKVLSEDYERWNGE